MKFSYHNHSNELQVMFYDNPDLVKQIQDSLPEKEIRIARHPRERDDDTGITYEMISRRANATVVGGSDDEETFETLINETFDKFINDMKRFHSKIIYVYLIGSAGHTKDTKGNIRFGLRYRYSNDIGNHQNE